MPSFPEPSLLAEALPLLTWVQFGLLLVLGVFGLHRGWLGLRSLFCRWTEVPETTPGDTPTPPVTIQLPIYNERYVATRLLDAVLAMDWPADRLQIQVLDDSTDDTTELLQQRIEDHRQTLGAAMPRVDHIRRPERRGFKAGALAHGLQAAGPQAASGRFVAIFDADFVPPRDFLQRVLPAFGPEQNRVGMVQTRWEHLNPGESWLTRVQALLLDGHFAVEHLARAQSGHMFNFNGTAGVFRRECLETTGWEGDTLTEDMDLSYRAQLAGWRFRYRPDIACPAELPTEMAAFLKQQHRWAKGGIQTAAKNLLPLLRSRQPLGTKLEGAFHLLSNAAFPVLLLLILVSLPLQLARHAHGGVAGVVHGLEAGLLGLSTLAVLLHYGIAQQRLGRLTGGIQSMMALLRLPLVLVAGAGLTVNNTVAVLGGLRRDPGVFTRTPKRGATTHSVYRSPRGWLPLVEWAMGCWAATTAALAWPLGLWVTAAFHGLFALGLLWTGGACLRQSLKQRTVRRGHGAVSGRGDGTMRAAAVGS